MDGQCSLQIFYEIFYYQLIKAPNEEGTAQGRVEKEREREGAHV